MIAVDGRTSRGARCRSKPDGRASRTERPTRCPAGPAPQPPGRLPALAHRNRLRHHRPAHRTGQPRRSSPTRCAPTGGSRTGCTGYGRRLHRRPLPDLDRPRPSRHGDPANLAISLTDRPAPPTSPPSADIPSRPLRHDHITGRSTLPRPCPAGPLPPPAISAMLIFGPDEESTADPHVLTYARSSRARRPCLVGNRDFGCFDQSTNV